VLVVTRAALGHSSRSFWPRNLPAQVLVAAMGRAVQTGCLDPQTVLIDARRDQAANLAPLASVRAIGALARYD
jgi:hypothetical protein